MPILNCFVALFSFYVYECHIKTIALRMCHDTVYFYLFALMRQATINRIPKIHGRLAQSVSSNLFFRKPRCTETCSFVTLVENGVIFYVYQLRMKIYIEISVFSSECDPKTAR